MCSTFKYTEISGEPVVFLKYMYITSNCNISISWSTVTLQVVPAILEAVKDAEYEGTYIRSVSIGDISNFLKNVSLWNCFVI